MEDMDTDEANSSQQPLIDEDGFQMVSRRKKK
jgi:hypothetical protein